MVKSEREHMRTSMEDLSVCKSCCHNMTCHNITAYNSHRTSIYSKTTRQPNLCNSSCAILFQDGTAKLKAVTIPTYSEDAEDTNCLNKCSCSCSSVMNWYTVCSMHVMRWYKRQQTISTFSNIQYNIIDDNKLRRSGSLLAESVRG
jgi:hypothetical protein